MDRLPDSQPALPDRESVLPNWQPDLPNPEPVLPDWHTFCPIQIAISILYKACYQFSTSHSRVFGAVLQWEPVPWSPSDEPVRKSLRRSIVNRQSKISSLTAAHIK